MSERLEALNARLENLDEIVVRANESGLPVSAGALRFYVSEGLLPKEALEGDGERAGYDAGWILDALKAIHLMKERYRRPLGEIREVMRGLRGSPALLVEQLEALETELERAFGVEGDGEASASRVIEAFFARLTGREGARALEPSEISILDLIEAARGGAIERVESVPEGAVSVERARALEETFLSRFDARFSEREKILHPGEGKLLNAGARDRTCHRRTRGDEVVDLMKRLRVYDRALLHAMPQNEALFYRYFRRTVFGRREERLVVAAAAVSPLDELVERRFASRPAGVAELERALELVDPEPGPFYVVGVLSTTGWAPETEHHLPEGGDLLVTLVESVEGTRWRLIHNGDERWRELERWFDPESEREKIDRARRALAVHPDLAVRGGHVILDHVREDLGVDGPLLMQAIAELLERDRELSLMEVGGRQIIKRKRL